MKKIFVLLLVFPFWGISQEKSNIKWGKITLNDFNVKSEFLDSAKVDAIVIADVGESEFVAKTNEEKIAIEFTKKTRIKILNKSGFDAATIEVYLYHTTGTNFKEEKLNNIKAITYNIENGKIVESKLDFNQIFTERKNNNYNTKKFTFPSLKEGCIIEYSYTIQSDFLFNLQPWSFQGNYPILWSEYSVTIPEFFNYLTTSQGYQKLIFNKSVGQISFKFKSNDTKPEQFGKRYSGASLPITYDKYSGHQETYELKGTTESMTWHIKDVPPLNEESFTASINNHISKIEFQLKSITYPNSATNVVLNSWEKLDNILLEDENFGTFYTQNNNWLTNEIKLIVNDAMSVSQKVESIYNFIAKNFTKLNNGIYSTKSPKEIFASKKGNVADINLLLITMLRHEKIDANPVILSTKRNGVINTVFPLIDRFNYVICNVKIDSTMLFLDASYPNLKLGQLPTYCYNGYARLISKVPQSFDLNSNNILETGLTSLIIINEENGNWGAGYSSNLGTDASVNYRNKLKTTSEADYFKTLEKTFEGYNATISNKSTENLNNINDNIEIKFDINFSKLTEDIIYFNPMMDKSYKKNPFSSAKREYPVEFDYRSSDIYAANIEVPNGYKVEELPKSEKFKLNDNEAIFEYYIVQKGNKIQLRSTININVATFLPEDYGLLRNFYATIVKKHAEQIVFKKIK